MTSDLGVSNSLWKLIDMAPLAFTVDWQNTLTYVEITCNADYITQSKELKPVLHVHGEETDLLYDISSDASIERINLMERNRGNCLCRRSVCLVVCLPCNGDRWLRKRVSYRSTHTEVVQIMIPGPTCD